MQLTAARIAANQSNAQHSTGPRTPEGKATVARNGVTLGLFSSRDLILPHELPEYDALRLGLEAELLPANIMEQTLAMEILHATWRLRRCSLVEANFLDAALESGLDPMQDPTACRTQTAVDRARSHARNNLRRATADLSRLQTERRLRAELDAAANPANPALPRPTDPECLASRQLITKELARDTRHRLTLRKLNGLGSFESLLRQAAGEVGKPAGYSFLTNQTHSAPYAAAFDGRPSSPPSTEARLY